MGTKVGYEMNENEAGRVCSWVMHLCTWLSIIQCMQHLNEKCLVTRTLKKRVMNISSDEGAFK